MSKSDEEAVTFVVLGFVGLAILGLVIWIVGSTIKFLNDNHFVYGLIVGVCVGIAVTFVIIGVITWWRNRQG